MTAPSRRDLLGGGAVLGAALIAPQATARAAGVPREWIEPKTGHRVVRLTGEEGGGKLYFYKDMFTPQGDKLVISTPGGIALIDMASRAVTPLVRDERADLMFMGKKTRTVYYSVSDRGVGQPSDRPRTIFAIDIDSGKTRRVARVEQGQIDALNCDETIFVGVVAYGDKPLQPDVPDPHNRKFGQAEYSAVGPDGKPLNFAKAKGVRMLQRWAARVPMELFVIDIATGQRRVIHRANDWLNHCQFSPTDPHQISFCHEGPWHRVNRLWRIRSDGSGLASMHQRTINMEIWGHEFFAPDGKTMLYDLQTPRGQVFWVASVDLATGKRVWRRVDQNCWSVHYNISPDQGLFAGDGGDGDMVGHAPDGKWLVLLRPEPVVDADLDSYDDAFITPLYMRPERLVDMAAHDYRLEPNVTFTPDGKWLVFGSNMHGRNHVYMVEIAKAG